MSFFEKIDKINEYLCESNIDTCWRAMIEEYKLYLMEAHRGASLTKPFGKFIKVDEDCYKCSSCEEIFDVFSDVLDFNYCPSCGAEIIKGEE